MLIQSQKFPFQIYRSLLSSIQIHPTVNFPLQDLNVHQPFHSIAVPPTTAANPPTRAQSGTNKPAAADFVDAILAVLEVAVLVIEVAVLAMELAVATIHAYLLSAPAAS